MIAEKSWRRLVTQPRNRRLQSSCCPTTPPTYTRRRLAGGGAEGRTQSANLCDEHLPLRPDRGDMCNVANVATRWLALISALVSMSCTSPPQHAAAQPPGFPDLGTFAPVPVESYIEPPEKGPPFAYFSTPYNISCFFEAGEVIPAWAEQAITCNGEFPGMDSGSCVVGRAAAAGMGPAYALNKTGHPCGGQFSHGKLLDVGQKVSAFNATCAVGSDHLVACLDTTQGHHGFVLKPSGSFAF